MGLTIERITMKTLAEITRYHRRNTPDKRALVYEQDNRSWTYKELDEEACQCANALLDLGIGAQDRAAYLDKNQPEYFTYLFGIAKLNAVSVAVNWRLAAAEMEYILNHSEAKILLIGDEFLYLLEQMDLHLKQVIVIGDPGDSGYLSYEQWMAGRSTNDPAYPADPNDTCYQLYTSGTTGLPKGVETTHNNLIYQLSKGLAPLEFTEGSVNLVCMPLFHISGSGWGLIGIYFGSESILLKEPDMQAILKVIPDYGITHSIFVPAVLQLLLDQPNIDDVDFSSLKRVAYGASPISEQVLVRAINTFKADFFQAYGLTESTGGVSLLFPEDHDPGGDRADLLRSCGKVVSGHELKIVDSTSNEEVADGEVGEIWIRGPQIMKGYWRNEKATVESISEEGWFKSGDAGYIIDEYLYIHDRVKDMIISGGENIYPAEIENVLMKHDQISDVAIIGVPDDRWGETVKAIVTRSDESLSEEAIISYCRQHLAHYKCPSSVDWLAEIPRNPSGKILKTDLRKPYWANKQRNVS